MLANPNDQYVGQALLRYGEYAESEARFLGQLLPRRGMIVEVCANIVPIRSGRAATPLPQVSKWLPSSPNPSCSRTCAPISR